MGEELSIDRPRWERLRHKLNALAVARGKPERFEVVPDQGNDMCEVVYDRLGTERRKTLHALDVGKLLEPEQRGELDRLADSLF